jgi:hypothetical protein
MQACSPQAVVANCTYWPPPDPLPVPCPCCTSCCCSPCINSLSYVGQLRVQASSIQQEEAVPCGQGQRQLV